METLNSIIKNQEAGYLTFGTSGRETDLHIDSDGDVGIGITPPSGDKLHVAGDIVTSTTGKVKQKGAFMQSSTHQALTLGY